MSSAFGGKAGFNVDVIHFFPQGVLPAITLIGRVTRGRVARDGVWCDTGLLYPVALAALFKARFNTM